MTRIAILLHHRKGNKLVIHHLGNHWRSMGHDVVFYEGIGKRIEGDILIPQIDLTVTPKDYIEAIEAFDGIILNRGIYDISKKKISTQLVDESSEFEGEVIVKPNLNFNGYPELRLKSKASKGVFLVKKFFGLIPDAYKVYPNWSEVPNLFKNSGSYVIEKFLPQRDGVEFITYLTSFLGDAHRTLELRSRQPVIRGNSLASRREMDTPKEVIEERKRLGFDYGKFDYSFYNGKLVLFDANKTPGSPNMTMVSAILRDIGHGINYFVDQVK